MEAYLQSSPSNDSVMSGQYGSSSTAVQVLEQLLIARKPFCSTGAPLNSGIGAGGSREGSQGTVQSQPLWDPATGRRPIQVTSKTAHQYMAPCNSGSRASNASLDHGSNHGIAQYQRLTPISLPGKPSPVSSHSRHAAEMYDSKTQLSLSSPYNNHPTTAQQHLQPHSMPQRSSLYIPTSMSSSIINTCVFTTDMMTSMPGADPSDIRADLGCLQGMDCEVDNQLVFNVMDRYAGTGVGL